MSHKYLDDMIDLAIAHAGHDLLEEAGRDADEELVAASDAFKKRMDSIIEKDIRRWRRAKARKIAVKAAVVPLIFIVVSTAVIMSVDALRVQIYNLFITTDDDSTEINMSEQPPSMDDGGVPVDIPDGMAIPAYIPEGFRLVETSAGLSFKSIYESSDGQHIKITQMSIKMGSTFDTEENEYYEVKTGGKSIFVVKQKDGSDILVFNNDEYAFIIYGEISVGELLKIAESLILLK